MFTETDSVMKKLSFVFSIILMMLLLANSVFADETTGIADTVQQNENTIPEENADSNGFVITDGILLKYVGESPDPIVPQTVTHIAAGAFTHTKNVRSVTVGVECTAETGAFPNGITVYGFASSNVHAVAVFANCRFVDITPEKVTVTITYTHDFGAPAAVTYTAELAPGEQYHVLSPIINGFIADIPLVEGTAGLVNKNIAVTYSKNTSDGWHITHNTVKYYENDAPVRNDSRTIDGVIRTFDSNGNIILDKETLTIGTDTYYFENSAITTGYKIIGNSIRFFTAEGPMIRSTVFDGHEFDTSGNMLGHNVSVNVSGNTYYLVCDKLFSGYTTIDGNIVYFGTDYKMVKNTTLNSVKFGADGYVTGGINAKNLKISNIIPVFHTGEPIRPAITVSFESIVLTENVHYTVEYKNNIEIGKATVVVKGMGPVSGSREVNFDILGEKVYTLTIKYLTSTGTTIVSEYITALKKGEKYNIPSPEIEGYIPDVATVKGTMDDENLTVTVTYEKVKVTEESTDIPTEIDPVGPGYAEPDPMFKETESESSAKAESTVETTYTETVETIFHEITETNVIYNYELLCKVIVIDTLVCGALVLIIIKWNSIKAAVKKRTSSVVEDVDADDQ